MIRDDVGVHPEAARPRRKKMPWVLVVLVVVAGLAAAHVAGLTKPLAALTAQFGLGSSRNLRTPSARLVGEWESDDDPMFRYVCHVKPRDPSKGTGVYLAEDGNGMGAVIYKIESEDRSGTDLVMTEFLGAANFNVRARYSIARDGQSMTREYDYDGRHVSCRYRYIGPPTEDIPGISR